MDLQFVFGEFGLEFVDQRRREIPNEGDENAIFGSWNGTHFRECNVLSVLC